jgi:hypothetical protein
MTTYFNRDTLQLLILMLKTAVLVKLLESQSAIILATLRIYEQHFIALYTLIISLQPLY